MGRARIDMHRLQEVIRLHRLGRSGRAIARQLGIGRNTLNGYFEAFASWGVSSFDTKRRVRPFISNSTSMITLIRIA